MNVSIITPSLSRLDQAQSDNLALAYRQRYQRDPKQMVGLITGNCEWSDSITHGDLINLWSRCADMMNLESANTVRRAMLSAAYFELRDRIVVAEIEAQNRKGIDPYAPKGWSA